MQRIHVTSVQAPIAHDLCRGVALRIGEAVGIATRFVDQPGWRERSRALEDGAIQLGWVCGLPYVRDAYRTDPCWRLLAAPVMRGARYGGRAEYFSDVVVRADSAARRFGDLRGRRWAFNEPASQSGWNVVLAHLAASHECDGFFGRVIEAGSHAEAIAAVLDGRADAAAIDSTVLEQMRARRPGMERLRIIAALGPSPMPPWVVHRSVDPSLAGSLRDALVRLHRDKRSARLLDDWGVERFVPVADRDYDPIRAMVEQARGVRPGRLDALSVNAA